MKFEAGKEYVTRSGHQARVLKIEKDGARFPVVGEVLMDDVWAISLWHENGKSAGHAQLDLIEPASLHNSLRQLITELREKPWHLDPAKMADRLEGILEDRE